MVRCATNSALVLEKLVCVRSMGRKREVYEEINDFQSEREVKFFLFSASGDDDF